jgi:hypothetical protein
MSTSYKSLIVATMLLFAIVLGCKSSGTNSNTSNSNKPSSSKSEAKPDDKGVLRSGTGEEKEKPAAGKSNVQGKVFFNSAGAPNIEVKLCEKFNQFMGGCQGQTYTTRTDGNGEYLIKDVPPGIYEGLIAKVFDTPFYVFATSGLISSAKYELVADQTFFAPDTNLFKSDLKLLNPKAGAKVSPDGIELKWDQYPSAAYYKFSIYADTSTGAETIYDYINKRIEGTSNILEQPLKPGSYRVQVVAYNSNDVKIAESPDDIKFTVTGH